MNSEIGDESSAGEPADAESETSQLSRALDDLAAAGGAGANHLADPRGQPPG